ncbi:hypothetical protein PFICI_14595 [Pestalotiopsis fici W106-1]|uniref:C3H1-type domain-containing protein n=1 Tax=Pestalotiopsis fici (strain W106-1 / CGMCC3.15140) TaxID=1229662 RepID=W3WIN3_PESFW|nr:uncharacterized protein PFICI_14595 [Pestalotiopsis fici W106-1]ETS73649.1 hypothetical protein PFICI_14595 [Pestalotiopsis fici W106-1]
MDIRAHAERCMKDTEVILRDAQEWMGNFITTDHQKNEVITVSSILFRVPVQVPHGHLGHSPSSHPSFAACYRDPSIPAALTIARCTHASGTGLSGQLSIAALIQRLEDEQHQKDQLKRDLAAEHKSRNNFQMEAERYESVVQRLEQKINEGSFIAVLIDGDGAKFADAFIRNPVDGAPRAAQVLKQAVRTYIENEVPELNGDDIPILIRVYANLNGLAQSLRLSRIIERDEDMKIFAEHLTNSRTEVDFVNVGRGKENADSKLRKMLSHYHNNLQCKKIFVACCHDNGYLHDLREYSDKNGLNKKIILVETTPAEPQFQTLGFPITRFDGVFRSRPLDNETKHLPPPLRTNSIQDTSPAAGLPVRQQSLPQAFPPPPPQPLPQSLPQPLPQPLPQALPKSPEQPTPQPQQQPARFVPTPASSESQPSPAPVKAEIEAVPRAPSIVNSGNGGTSISYATAGGHGGDFQNITIKSSKSKKQAKTILYNSEGSRIDPPTKHPANTPAQSTYQTKLEKVAPNAFCNDHYLVGICRRSGCERVHNIDLTPQEVSIHRYKARTSVCPRGPECDDYDCYLSHHCLKDPRCVRGSACKFYNTEYGNLHLDSNEKLQPATRWTQGSDFPEHLQ